MAIAPNGYIAPNGHITAQSVKWFSFEKQSKVCILSEEYDNYLHVYFSVEVDRNL